MEWLTSIRKTIDYIEKHLEDDISVQDMASQVYLSPFFLQKGFSLMTGYGIGEYVRNRRLYEAARDLLKSDEKIIDIACRYAYETPESFTKAFTRFHGCSPSKVREGKVPIRVFLPLNIDIRMQGGEKMECRITNKFPFRIIGFQKVFAYETSHREIPLFWDEIVDKYAKNVYAGKEAANAYEQAIIDNCIGEYGVCIDDIGSDGFRYLIAGRYSGGEVPEGMVLYEFPGSEWAVFDCIGPNPAALQSLTTRIFKEWLPGNPDYELSGNANVEWYDMNGDMNDPDYHSAVWIPVKRKNG